jgi:pyruvate kinase
MIKNPRPTRAEAADISHTVRDGADGFLLGNETANGAYPLNALSTLARSCKEAESMVNHKKSFIDAKRHTSLPISTTESIAASSVHAAFDLSADLIISVTESGRMAKYIAKYSPYQQVLACRYSIILKF